MECIRVSHYDGRAVLVSTTNSSLRLQLLPWQPPSTCADVSHPSVKYSVYYRAVNTVHTDLVCSPTHAACSHKVIYIKLLIQ